MFNSSERSIFIRFLALVGVALGTALAIIGVLYAFGGLGSLHCFYSSPMSLPVKPPGYKRYGVDLQRPTTSLFRGEPVHYGNYSIVSAWRNETPSRSDAVYYDHR